MYVRTSNYLQKGYLTDGGKMENCNGGNCNGCKYNGDDTTWICVLLSLGYERHDIKECPCEICIIKVVCSKRCNDFMTFLNTFNRGQKYYLRDGIITKYNYVNDNTIRGKSYPEINKQLPPITKKP